MMKLVLPLCAIFGAGAGCIRAPDVVIVDRKTALEQQASGSFRGLEEELERAALVPRAEPLTGAQLAAAGVSRNGAADDDAEGLPDALRADGLLVQRCIGESSDGTLVLTIEQCTGIVDVPSVNRLIERTNRNRRQLWRWMAGRTGRSPEQAQAAWRAVHATGLICGAQVQKSDGTWETKRC